MRRWPAGGEVIGIALLAVIGLWGLWFALQSLLTLWWPINAAYVIAGALVAGVSAAVAKAILNR